MRVPFIQQLPRKFPLKTVTIVSGVCAAAAVACAAFSWMPASASRTSASEPVARPARVMEIAYQQRSQSLVLAGTVVPRIESTLGFRVAGKITARTVDVGTIVKPGDLIAQLDPSDYRLAVDNARAALASADADYARVLERVVHLLHHVIERPAAAAAASDQKVHHHSDEFSLRVVTDGGIRKIILLAI